MSKLLEIQNAFNKLSIKPKQKNYEKIISQHCSCSFLYAIQVIKERFILGEKIISKDAYVSYLYAKDVIKGRFVEAESVIAKDVLTAEHYAKFIIKGRFIEAEHYNDLAAKIKEDENAYL